MKNKKSIIAFILILSILITSTSFASTVPGAKIVVDGHEFTIIENTDTLCTLVGYKDGESLTLTYDKINDSYLMTEKDRARLKFFNLEILAGKSTQYDVEVIDVNDDDVNLVATNLDNGKAIEIDSSSEDGSAQSVIGITLIMVLGEALVKALCLVIGALIIANATYFVLEKVAEELKRKRYNFYIAHINRTDKQVYVGPPISDYQAIARAKAGGDTFAKTAILAQTLAGHTGVSFSGPDWHNQGQPGYLPHYHNCTAGGAHISHIFFPPSLYIEF